MANQRTLFCDNELNELASIRWWSWSEQYSELLVSLTEDGLIKLKQSLALSDFVFESANTLPKAFVELFKTEVSLVDLSSRYQQLLATLLQDVTSEVGLYAELRKFRRQQMMTIAIQDMAFGTPLDDCLKGLSRLADAMIIQTLNWLYDHFEPQWGSARNDTGDRLPLLVLGMGKLGGEELNFSSDIDLIFTYPQMGETQGGRRSLDNQTYFTRIGQKLINALDQITQDGFAYRVDMRLRPFGDSGPLVLSFSALEDYYQEQGRDWERYAMLKARVIGDEKYADILNRMMRPFVFRRYIDFSVIDSLRQMKEMIAQEVRRRQLNNNIKLGAGGIREVEFVVQVFQLIRGGRLPELQIKHVLSVLPKLNALGELSQESERKLTLGYRFLRRAENVLQALNDEQTQTLPESSLDRARLAHVLGFNDWAAFIETCNEHMKAIHDEFNRVIGRDEPKQKLEHEHWQTLWSARLTNEEAIALISQHQTHWDGEAITRILFDFKQEATKRGIGQRGQLVLDKLIPMVIERLPSTEAASITLSRILHLLTKIVGRTAYLELLYENQGALNHLIKLCAQSEWLTQHLAKFPILLDELIDPKLLYDTPKLSDYQVMLRQVMLRVPEDDLELQMETLRQFKQARQLHVAAADISEILSVGQVSEHLTALAEALIEQVINIAWQQVSQRFGVPSKLSSPHEKDFAVIGYGKSGGNELGYGSDLDLVFVHCAQENDITTGEKPVPASQFYLKLAQRILHIFNTTTASGILYDVDMRLRPSGNSGLMVVHINTFESYQYQDAWTWEHQALVRARMLFGNSELFQRFKNIRADVLCLQRDVAKLREEVIEMRDRMRQHLDKSTDDLIDLKQSQGGLVDIEFLAQYLVLANANTHRTLVAHSDNLNIFKHAEQLGIISLEEAKVLISSYKNLRDLGHQKALQGEDALLNRAEHGKCFTDVSKIWNSHFS